MSDYDAHGDVHGVDELRAILRTASRAGRISGRQQHFGENVPGLVRLQVRHTVTEMSGRRVARLRFERAGLPPGEQAGCSRGLAARVSATLGLRL